MIRHCVVALAVAAWLAVMLLMGPEPALDEHYGERLVNDG